MNLVSLLDDKLQNRVIDTNLEYTYIYLGIFIRIYFFKCNLVCVHRKETSMTEFNPKLLELLRKKEYNLSI